MKFIRIVTSVLLSGTLVAGAAAKDLVVLCAGAVKPVLSALEPSWVARSGHRLLVSYATAGELRAALAAGTQADIVILPLENFGAVERDGVTLAGSRRELGAVGIGVAVKQGAPLPDLSSEEGLRRALLGARAVTWMEPTRGTSGKHFDEVVLPRLGIRDEVRRKTVFGMGGMIAEKVASGEVEIAFQQMTELLPVAGITIAGPLPPSLQKTTVYSGAVLKVSHAPAKAAELLAFLVSADARREFLAKGFSAP